MKLDPNYTLEQVEGHPDTVAFQYGFIPEGKSLDDGSTAQVVTELEDGDLLIEGYAAVFQGVDREGENFVDGSFQRGCKAFLDGQAALTYHHSNAIGIGKVLELEEHPGKGLFMRARVDYQPESSPFFFAYNGIKKGTYNGLSAQGFFKRKLTENGWRIADTDLTRITVTPVPVHPGTHFGVVAGKALQDIEVPDVVEDSDIRQADKDSIKFILEQLAFIFEAISRRGTEKSEASQLAPV